MIESRDYMREPEYGSRWRWSVTLVLLAINVGMYLVGVLFPKIPFDQYLGLSLGGLRNGFVWQLVTFQFLHGGLIHLLLNSWGIYVFGQVVEKALGGTQYLKLYLVSGVAGGVLHVLGGIVFPQHFGVITVGDASIYIPVVGASAGLYGLIAAFATLFPHQTLTVFLFFVLPVTVSARALAGVSAGIAVLGMLMAKDNVAHGAHLGGMLAGWLFIRLQMQRSAFDNDRPDTSQFRRRMTGVLARKLSKSVEPAAPPEELSPKEFVSSEVDPILDKISAHGIQSLTERERKILEAAQKKMSGR